MPLIESQNVVKDALAKYKTTARDIFVKYIIIPRDSFIKYKIAAIYTLAKI